MVDRNTYVLDHHVHLWSGHPLHERVRSPAHPLFLLTYGSSTFRVGNVESARSRF